MLPYFLLLFISLVIPMLVYMPQRILPKEEYDNFSYKRNKLTLFLFFFGLFLLLSLRAISVGKDLLTYKSIFEKCTRTAFEKLPTLKWELGYVAYNKVVSLATTNYRHFLIITAIITTLPIYKLYIREKKHALLTILLFINMPCFLMMFSGLRQAIAISMGVLAYQALDKKRYISSVALIILATYFHASAFVLVLLYVAFFLKIKAKHLYFVIPIMGAIYIFRVQILEYVIDFLPQYEEFYGEVEQTGAIGMMLLFLIFSIFAFIVIDEKFMTKKDYFMRNVLLIATIFQFFVPIHDLVQRASYYFLVFTPLSVTCVVSAPKKTMKEVSDLALVVMSCFFALYFFYNGAFSTDNLLDVFPYKFYWSNKL